MRLVSLNISNLQQVEFRGNTVGTGIFKRSVAGPVLATTRTLQGDRQVDLRVHGGEHKAIYCYPHEHYAHWREVLQRDELPMGQFGENFTMEGLLETEVHIGDRFRIGEIEIEVTQPRIPCFKLGIAVGDPRFVKTFLESECCGFYVRVLQEGHVQAGDTFERTYEHPEAVAIQYIHQLYFRDSGNTAEVERMLNIEPLSTEWKKQFREL